MYLTRRGWFNCCFGWHDAYLLPERKKLAGDDDVSLTFIHNSNRPVLQLVRRMVAYKIYSPFDSDDPASLGQVGVPSEANTIKQVLEHMCSLKKITTHSSYEVYSNDQHLDLDEPCLSYLSYHGPDKVLIFKPSKAIFIVSFA